jgi:putative hemolysin
LADTVEIGRACVDPEFRGGAVIALLWSGLIRYLVAGGYRYVMGCASIDADDPLEAARICRRILSKHPIALPRPVRPHRPFDLGDGAIAGRGSTPALIKTYLRLGAEICGPPAYDAEFRTADLLLLLAMERLDRDHVDRVRRVR